MGKPTKHEAPAEQTKEVVVKAQQSIANTDFEMDADLAGLMPRAEARDFVIPRLTLIQPTSKIPGNPGDLQDSETKQAVASVGSEFHFVPIFFMKDIAITDKETGKWKRNEVKDSGNAHLTTFENRVGSDSDGKMVERKERLNLFVVKATDLEKQFPPLFRLILKPSSMKEAKKFITAWDLDLQCRQIPFAKIWCIKTKVEVNDQGKFAVCEFIKVMDGNNQKKITVEQLSPIKSWVKLLAANKEQAVAGTDEEETEAPAGAPTQQTHAF